MENHPYRDARIQQAHENFNLLLPVLKLETGQLL